MEEDGTDSYYLQDDLGSPMQLLDEAGKVRETYGFDEFGRNLAHSPGKQLQPFGYTGYQKEPALGACGLEWNIPCRNQVIMNISIQPIFIIVTNI